MKSQLAVGGMLVAAAVAWAAEPGTTTANAEPGTFGYDVGFLKRCTEVIVLAQGDAQVAVAPAYQGRVMTSTFGGLAGPSFGWLNYRVIERGLVPEPERKGQLEDHIYVFGGEERFWLGPEGGQFAIFFKPGEPFDFDHWHTPAVIDTEPFELVSQDATAAKFKKAFDLVNYSGTKLKGEVERTIRLLTPAAAEEAFGFKLAEGVKAVAYETDNRLFNRGTTPWMKEKGRLSIWLLGMYKPGPATTIVIPFKAGPEAELGPKVNDAYFGKVPADRLVVKDNVLFFSGDGQYRSKLGISPKRSLGLAGSYDAAGNVLTLVTCSVLRELDVGAAEGSLRRRRAQLLQRRLARAGQAAAGPVLRAGNLLARRRARPGAGPHAPPAHAASQRAEGGARRDRARQAGGRPGRNHGGAQAGQVTL